MYAFLIIVVIVLQLMEQLHAARMVVTDRAQSHAHQMGVVIVHQRTVQNLALL